MKERERKRTYPENIYIVWHIKYTESDGCAKSHREILSIFVDR